MNGTSGTARARKAVTGNSTATPGTGDPTSTDKMTRSKGPVTNEDLQEIQDSQGGRSMLEKKQLLVPAGQGLTAARAAICLFQISQMDSRTPGVVVNAMRGLAFLIEEMEIPIATQVYHDGFGEELTTFTNEIKSLITHTQEKVDQKLEEITKATSNLIKTAEDTAKITPQQTPLYSQVARGHVSHSQIAAQPAVSANPRLLARHGIRARQLMLEGIAKESKLGTHGDREAKDFINKVLAKLEPEGSIRIRSATRQRNGGMLVEFDSDFGAAWARVEDNRDKLCKEIGDDVTTKKRTYEVIAMGAPITAEPEDADFIQEIEESNKIEDGTIVSMRWAKKVSRREPGQKCAHIIITVNDPKEANRLIALGMYIANKRVKVQKCKVDPIRCMKCQGYNHYAKECTAKEDTCGHCGAKGHRTSNCERENMHCISCDADDHPSYARECPYFKKKVEEKDQRIPENRLPFIPTDEPWTWATSVDAAPPFKSTTKGFQRGQSPRWTVQDVSRKTTPRQMSPASQSDDANEEATKET